MTGDHWRDRLTKAFSGPDVTMSATVWGGPLVLVIARFRRTTSYGMVSIRPVSDGAEHRDHRRLGAATTKLGGAPGRPD